MKLLVVGGGGREHALAWRLSQEAKVWCTPGNPGIAEDVETLEVKATDTDGLIAAAKNLGVDAVVVGPEDPLVNGLADAFRQAGVPVYGPGAEGARLEASKAFSKDLMAEAGVPTAAYANFTDSANALAYARERYAEGTSLAVKASGNALGKGVVVADTFEEAEDAIRRMMDSREFGEAGATIVLEERLVGAEFSLLTMVSDKGYQSLPVAQDHKRAYEGDQGPNTGGMGTFAPILSVGQDVIEETEARVVRPILAALAARGISYRGTLFSGLMFHHGAVRCLEYNVRFGDPETQTVMRLVGSGFAEAVLACARGESIPPFEVSGESAVTVVVASGGYPGDYAKGLSIEIGDLPAGAKLFHAGTARDSEGRLVTSGGRVIGASATGLDLASARAAAYRAAAAVRFDGAFFRRDIGG
ncbi:phosphoribosylamine--glycine ligase [bacterium]|nr:MAG: phosphoribosylamine--glycine ligase [bacterium]